MIDIANLTEKQKSELNSFKGLLSYRHTPHSRAYLSSDYEIVFISKGNQAGGCKCMSTLILRQDGSRVLIGDIRKGDSVLSIDDKHRVVSSKVLKTIDSGRKQVYRLETQKKRVDVSTGCHPYLTIDGWKELKDLKVGDRIAVPRKYNIANKETREDWEYILLGYLLGDGSMSVRHVRITNKDDFIIDEVRNIVDKKGYNLNRVVNTISYGISGKRRVGKEGNYYVNWLDGFGLIGKNTWTKFIPDFIFKSSNRQIGLFLSRLFSADGWVSSSGIGYCSVNKDLMYGVQHLLIRFGINARVRVKKGRYKEFPSGNKYQERDCYTLEFKGKDEVVRFSKEIGIYSKQERLDEFVREVSSKPSKINKDTVPVDIKLMYKGIPIDKETGCKEKDKYDALREARGVSVTREKLDKIADIFEDDELKNLANSDIYWDEIASIEDAGVQQCYDLEIEGTHNFIANDIFVHNTALIAYGYVLRILGWHPVPRKNITYFECPTAIKHIEAQRADIDVEGWPEGMYWSPKQYYNSMVGVPCPCCGGEITKHERLYKIYRFASQNLPETKNNQSGDPNDSDSETKNTQYPEFTSWLPSFLLKKDITNRERVQYIHDIYGGKDILVEYVGYNQQTQTVAGHKRTSCWLDELAPERFYDEQPARLLIEDGDINISYTPTVDNAISYYFDRVYDRAKVYYKTPSMREYYKKNHDIVYPEIEYTDSDESIAVIQMSTYDNPMLIRSVIDRKASALGDEDPMLRDMRIYGIFAAVTGKIYKQFSPRVHIISENHYFPNGIFDEWTFFRSEDYHPATDLAIVWVALSPTNEMFVWEELTIDPERNNTLSVCEAIARISGSSKRYAMNMIDPLAATKQSNTSRSVIDDMNRYFQEFKRAGMCTGGVWESANTKGGVSKSLHNIRGREQLRLRLYNSILCEVPFNNRQEKDGLVKRLPTLWVLNNCKQVGKSLRNWRIEDGKETVAWSHFCTALEFILKDIRFTPRRVTPVKRKQAKQVGYYSRSRR